MKIVAIKNFLITAGVTTAILFILIGLNFLLAFSSPILGLPYTTNDMDNAYLIFRGNTVTFVGYEDNPSANYIAYDNIIEIENETWEKNGYSIFANDTEFVCGAAWTFQILLIFAYVTGLLVYCVVILGIYKYRND